MSKEVKVIPPPDVEFANGERKIYLYPFEGVCLWDQTGGIWYANTSIIFPFGLHPKDITMGCANIGEAVKAQKILSAIEGNWAEKEVKMAGRKTMRLAVVPVRERENIWGTICVVWEKEEGQESEGELAPLTQEAVRQRGTLELKDVLKILEAGEKPEDDPGESINFSVVPADLSRIDTAYDSRVYFLKDIENITLLTAERERKLAMTIEQERKNITKALKDENKNAAADAQERLAAARQELIISNLKLVAKIARNFEDQGLPLSDLMQEGYFGLERAVDKFNYRYGVKFSTYAYSWIRVFMQRAIADKVRTIRNPVHIGEKINHITKTEMYLRGELGREPTTAEIAEYLQWTKDQLEGYLEAARRQVRSLDTFVHVGDTRLGIHEKTPDLNRAYWPEAVIDIDDMRRTIFAILAKIDVKPIKLEAFILRKGLGGREERTLQSVGDQLGLSRECVRLYEEDVMDALKNLPAEDLAMLKDYY